jgi:MoxR-like ATPase
MIDLRLGQMEPTDIRGIPFYNKEVGKMDWAEPIDLPSKEFAADYPVVVLFLDEMNSSAPSVQAAAYQLILNRRIGKYHLPDNVVIVAVTGEECHAVAAVAAFALRGGGSCLLRYRNDFTSF